MQKIDHVDHISHNSRIGKASSYCTRDREYHSNKSVHDSHYDRTVQIDHLITTLGNPDNTHHHDGIGTAEQAHH